MGCGASKAHQGSLDPTPVAAPHQQPEPIKADAQVPTSSKHTASDPLDAGKKLAVDRVEETHVVAFASIDRALSATPAAEATVTISDGLPGATSMPNTEPLPVPAVENPRDIEVPDQLNQATAPISTPRAEAFMTTAQEGLPANHGRQEPLTEPLTEAVIGQQIQDNSTRLEEEIAPFEAEKSEVHEASEASPWANLQKTYSNVEEGTHSLPGDQLQANVDSLPVHHEVNLVAEQPTPLMQAEAPSGSQPGQIISTESSWPAADRPSHTDNAWGDPAAAFASSQAVSAPLQKAHKPAPAAAQPVVQVETDMLMEDVDDF